MRVDVSYKYLERSDFIDNVLDKNIQKIARRIQIFRRDDPIHVSIHIEKNPHRDRYSCRGNIYLPARVLKVEEQGTDITLTINKTFSAFSKQLEKLKYKVEKHLRRKNSKAKNLNRGDEE